MSICIPVNEDHGLDSPVCAHFGSAPMFLIVDTESGTCRAIVNGNQHHEHGHCSPLASLKGEELDGMVVGGIGRGALNALSRVGIPVFAAGHALVRDNVSAFVAGKLTPMRLDGACGGHGH